MLPMPIETVHQSNAARQDALWMLKLMVQGEADIQKNRLVAQGMLFDSLRASLLKRKN
jgi:hypothetical protein